MTLDLLMTTSQIQRRLVDFRFYRIQPPHPSHGQALVTPLSPLSLTWFFFFSPLLSGSLILHPDKQTHAHISLHTPLLFTPSR